MSLLTLNVDDPKVREAIRDTVRDFLNNTLADLNVPDKVEFTVERKADHIAVDWDGIIEHRQRGPDPDLLRARLYEDHATIDLHISNIRINYG